MNEPSQQTPMTTETASDDLPPVMAPNPRSMKAIEHIGDATRKLLDLTQAYIRETVLSASETEPDPSAASARVATVSAAAKRLVGEITKIVGGAYDAGWEHGVDGITRNMPRELSADQQKDVVLAAVRRQYHQDVTSISLNILSAKMMRDVFAMVRGDSMGNPAPTSDIRDLVDESIIVGKMFVDELAKQEPPKHIIERSAARFGVQQS